MKKINSVLDLFQDKSIRAIGIIADPNTGKSNTIYHCIRALREQYESSMYSYGLRIRVDEIQQINSIEQLEKIRNSVVFLDEFPSLFSLNNARQREKFEESMRKIYHSNNIMIVCGLPHNYNKFLSGLMNAWIFKQCTLADFIQRSPVERLITSFSDAGFVEISKGSRVLNMPKDVALIWDGENYHEVSVPYEEYGDSKKSNKDILKPRSLSVAEFVSVTV